MSVARDGVLFNSHFCNIVFSLVSMLLRARWIIQRISYRTRYGIRKFRSSVTDIEVTLKVKNIQINSPRR